MLRKTFLAFSLICLGSIFVACASSSSNILNVDNKSISSIKGNTLGTYSDYGKEIQYNEQDKLYHYIIYVGGTGSCDGGAILYAKPKLDKFMQDNGFNSYKIVRGNYTLMPMSKCDLSIEFKK
jgi:hypothetical protein